MDLTVMLSLITAITAIAAPSITEVIRSKNALRIKQLEIHETAKREAFSRFSKSLSLWQLFQTVSNQDHIQEILSGIYEAAIYCDAPTQEELHKLIVLIREAEDNGNYVLVEQQFQVCITKIGSLNQSFGDLAHK